ncbi:hypothetical protein [Actinoplanes sp. NPDC051494]|uniref:hypothetical protein n=1 Tax=Actinoplanes sp. NPDC051494 TaxID=3363907 RepID=UPI003793AD77
MRTIAFAAVALATAATLTACANAEPPVAGAPAPTTPSPATPSPTTPSTATSSPAATTTSPSPAKSATATSTRPAEGTSDLSQLKKFGIDLGEGVLIDVADDGVDRWMQIGKNGVVDFTGTTKTDSTMMSLKAAPGRVKNRVLIKPPFWNEDLGKGSCVADTPGAALALQTCEAGKDAQVWTVVPAGDSGQFELKGAYGVITVENGNITTGGTGRTGLQTIPFAS